MSLFGLSKLWSYVLIGVTALTLALGAYFYVRNQGVEHAQKQVATHNVEVLDKAREADSNATATVLTQTRIIERHTNDVKEVIREVPDNGLNPISRARLERVREQQQAEGEADSNADSNSAGLP